MKLFAVFLALLPATTSAAPFTCGEPARTAALQQRLATHYGDVPPALDCAKASGNAARICANPSLRDMAALADQSYVYAYENATGAETDHANPERDTAATDQLGACADEACLCSTLIEKINDNMGADNPYGDYRAN